MGRVVLVVDDDPLVLEVTSSMLEELGCDVIVATSASECFGAPGEQSASRNPRHGHQHARHKRIRVGREGTTDEEEPSGNTVVRS
jgi:hypothetical protein